MSQPAQRLPDLPSGPQVTLADWLNISHELRTPANAIQGHLDLLTSGALGPLSSEARASIGEIQRASRDLVAIILHTIDAAQDVKSCDAFSPEIGALFRHLEHAWSTSAQAMIATASPSPVKMGPQAPTCWLQVTAVLLHKLGARPSPSGLSSRLEPLCDIDHTQQVELRFDLHHASEVDVSTSLPMIMAAQEKTGGNVERCADQIVFVWPFKKSSDIGIAPNFE